MTKTEVLKRHLMTKRRSFECLTNYKDLYKQGIFKTEQGLALKTSPFAKHTWYPR